MADIVAYGKVYCKQARKPIAIKGKTLPDFFGGCVN